MIAEEIQKQMDSEAVHQTVEAEVANQMQSEMIRSKIAENVDIQMETEQVQALIDQNIREQMASSKVQKLSLIHIFNQVLDEMWLVAQEEMNFQTEAANLERFHRLNEDVAFVTSPQLHREYTTTHVLVMERIDGIAIDDHEALRAAGYDLSLIHI